MDLRRFGGDRLSKGNSCFGALLDLPIGVYGGACRPRIRKSRRVLCALDTKRQTHHALFAAGAKRTHDRRYRKPRAEAPDGHLQMVRADAHAE